MVDELKNYLDITWQDEGTDKKLSGILERGQHILQSYAGCELSFEGSEKQLLLDLCRYLWNHAYEDFARNFHSELLMLRAMRRVAADEASSNAP